MIILLIIFDKKIFLILSPEFNNTFSILVLYKKLNIKHLLLKIIIVIGLYTLLESKLFLINNSIQYFLVLFLTTTNILTYRKKQYQTEFLLPKLKRHR